MKAWCNLSIIDFSNIKSLSDKDLARFQRLMYDLTGVSLSDAKRTLIEGRLSKRLRELKITDFGKYLDIAEQGGDELQFMINCLTTNETYFFRESNHFDFLAKLTKEWRSNSSLRVWSAACSSGEEPYTIAMIIDHNIDRSLRWEVAASDINSKILGTAVKGIYPDNRGEKIPPEYKKKYCLKGINQNEGKILVDHSLRQKVKFYQINLKETIPDIGVFTVVFLRNVLIYFDNNSKRRVLENIYNRIGDGGFLILGHSETLLEHGDLYKKTESTIYIKQ